MKKKTAKKPMTIQQKIRRREFLSFGIFGTLGAAAFGGWKWLYHSPLEVKGITAGAHKPLRRALNKTEIFFRRFTFNENHLVKTYPVDRAAKNVRKNTVIGAKGEIDNDAWQLEVLRKNGTVLKVGLEEIKSLPKTDLVFDFKCVEGWDQIQHWAGVTLLDFIKHYGLQEESEQAYVGMMTPDKGYYVGLDMPSALHPQTILAYEMNGKPLSAGHGKP